MNWKDKWEQSDAYKRIVAVDSFAQNHGFAEFKGENVPDFIQSTLREELEGIEKEFIENCHRTIGNEWSEGERYGGVRALMKKVIQERIKELK